MPFAATDDQPLRERLEKLAGDMQQRRYKMPERLSAGAKDLLGQLLQPDPKARITVAGAFVDSCVLLCVVYVCMRLSGRGGCLAH